MALVRVAILGTIGKGILLDTTINARVAALEVAVAAGAAGGITAHNQLTGLQVGDDHSQYALVAATETISAPWNFAVLPFIGGVELDEFIEDTIGNELENSSSIYLTYSDYGGTHGKITAHINDEYVEDLVGSMLLDTSSIDLTYNDANGTISAALTAAFSGANPTAQVGLAAVNGVATNYMRSDGAPALDQGIVPTWTGKHTFTNADGIVISNTDTVLTILDTDAASDEKWYWLRNSAGLFRLQTRTDAGGLGSDVFLIDRNGTAVTLVNFGNTTDNPAFNFLGTGTAIHGGRVRLKNYTVATLPAGTQGDIAYVTDALAPTFGAAVVGGGAVVIPVFYDGTNWVSF